MKAVVIVVILLVVLSAALAGPPAAPTPRVALAPVSKIPADLAGLDLTPDQARRIVDAIDTRDVALLAAEREYMRAKSAAGIVYDAAISAVLTPEQQYRLKEQREQRVRDELAELRSLVTKMAAELRETRAELAKLRSGEGTDRPVDVPPQPRVGAGARPRPTWRP